MQLQTSRISKKALWRIYAAAFLILVGTISASHYLADWIVKQQEQYASIINTSGKQRMLSQRITGLLADDFLATDAQEREARIEMVDSSLKTMANAHALLTNQSDFNVEAVMSDGIRRIYFGASPNLDEKVKQYLEEAVFLRDLAASGQNTDAGRMQKFATNGFGDLLASLDRAVSQYEADAEAKLDRLRNLNIGLWVFTIAVIVIELLVIFRPLARRLDDAQQELEDIAHTDPLTGCYNRRALMQAGEMLWSLEKRGGRPLSVAICDIDKFKRINDTYGHGVGDEAIRVFAQTCLDGLRQYDVLGRFGGEEFVLVLPDTDQAGAELVAERIRQALEQKTVTAEGATFNMTASFGVAQMKDEDASLQALIDCADQALYAAKEGGRNCVECWQADKAA